MFFVDLEKVFNRIPRDLIWWCLRKKGVPEKYVKIVQDMYRRKEERREQTKFSRNEDVEMGKREDQVGSHQK